MEFLVFTGLIYFGLSVAIAARYLREGLDNIAREIRRAPQERKS